LFGCMLYVMADGDIDNSRTLLVVKVLYLPNDFCLFYVQLQDISCLHN